MKYLSSDMYRDVINVLSSPERAPIGRAPYESAKEGSGHSFVSGKESNVSWKPPIMEEERRRKMIFQEFLMCWKNFHH